MIFRRKFLGFHGEAEAEDIQNPSPNFQKFAINIVPPKKTKIFWGFYTPYFHARLFSTISIKIWQHRRKDRTRNYSLFEPRQKAITPIY